MAKVVPGILGVLTGKIGDLVVCRRGKGGLRADPGAPQEPEDPAPAAAAPRLFGGRRRVEGTTAFNVATGDFLHPPEIKQIRCAKYRGAIGDVIEIVALDDVLVKAVAVTVLAGGGAIVRRCGSTRRPGLPAPSR